MIQHIVAGDVVQHDGAARRGFIEYKDSSGAGIAAAGVARFINARHAGINRIFAFITVGENTGGFGFYAVSAVCLHSGGVSNVAYADGNDAAGFTVGNLARNSEIRLSQLDFVYHIIAGDAVDADGSGIHQINSIRTSGEGGVVHPRIIGQRNHGGDGAVGGCGAGTYAKKCFVDLHAELAVCNDCLDILKAGIQGDFGVVGYIFHAAGYGKYISVGFCFTDDAVFRNRVKRNYRCGQAGLITAAVFGHCDIVGAIGYRSVYADLVNSQQLLGRNLDLIVVASETGLMILSVYLHHHAADGFAFLYATNGTGYSMLRLCTLFFAEYIIARNLINRHAYFGCLQVFAKALTGFNSGNIARIIT